MIGPSLILPYLGTAFGGARGRTEVPEIVELSMEGKIHIDPMIAHTVPLTTSMRGSISCTGANASEV
jgi:hypothetical protein